MIQVKKIMKQVVVLTMLVCTLVCSGGISDVLVGNILVAEAATLKLSKKSVELVPYESIKLQVTNAGKKKITWKSLNAKVATVTTSGKVTAKDAIGKTCIVTASVGKKHLKCEISVVESKYYGSFNVYTTNVTVSGTASDGKTYVDNAWVEAIDVVMKKDGYYYNITEAHSDDIDDCDWNIPSDNNGRGFYIGKKLPKCMTNPTKYNGHNAVNLWMDANDKSVFETWRDYTDDEWDELWKKLGL